MNRKRPQRKSIFLNKLVLPAVIGIAALTLFFSLQSVYYLRRTAVLNGTAMQTELTAQVMKDIEASLEHMDNVAYLVMNEPRLITVFNALAEDEDRRNHFREDLVEDIEYSTILAAFNQITPPIWRICIYNDKGDFISTGAVCDYRRVSERLASIDVGAVMREAARDPLSHSVLLYAKDVWNDAFSSSYITMRCPLMNIYSSAVYGVVELTADVRLYDRILADYASYGCDITVCDSNGSTVAAVSASGEGKRVETDALSEKYGWKVSVSGREADMLRSYRLAQLVVLTGILFVAAAAVFIIYKVVSKTLTPFERLTETVRSVSFAGNPPEKTHDGQIDEVKELDIAFSEMLSRLNNAMVLEKKATVLALQSQMNPHFLYNMLAVIGAAGAQSGAENVEMLCRRLSEMLRYSASYERTTVTLYDEVTHLNAYLALMKARYEDFLEYSVDIPPEMYRLTVPKLFLQPLAENCFSHGFAGSEPPYEVRVTGELLGDRFRITVSDNGVGFSDAQRDFVVERVRRLEENVSENLSQTSIGGLGLASTVLRLRLVSGKSITFDILNRSPHGAEIILEGTL